MILVPDTTGRLALRPVFSTAELDRECERVVRRFMSKKYSGLRLPIPTDALMGLIEGEAADLDAYADLSTEGDDVDGLTDFFRNELPQVKVSERLSAGTNEYRLRSTLTHEFGHVHLHGWLFQRFPRAGAGDGLRCLRIGTSPARATDWMEWQARYASGALLMPLSVLSSYVTEFFVRRGITGPVQAGSRNASDLILMLSRVFGVSTQLVHFRLLQLNHLVVAST